jgi:hypothetical protein
MTQIGYILSVLALIGGLELRVKSITKHYLDELKPNSGSSLKDQVNRLEAQTELIIQMLKK